MPRRVSSSAVATYQATVPGYVDLHSHVLPGIDDGPSDADGALAMLRAAATAGIETIAVTPHLRSDFPDVRVTELPRRAQELREAGEMAGIPIRVVSGAEVSLVWALEAGDDQLALATYDQGGTDLLVETPAFDVAGLESLLYRLRAKGLRVTLAHPERSVQFQRDPASLVDLVKQGVLLQVNADALLVGPRRSDTHRLGRYLCVEGLAHALASDGHRANAWRPVTRLADAADEAATLIGPDRARWMTQSAPAAIIAGAELPEAPALRTGRRMHKLLRRR
jgi:protein-tyrosine phosphatase